MHFEDGERDHESRDVGSLWKLEKTRQQIFSKSLQKKATLLFLVPSDPFRTSDLQKCTVIYLCSFKPFVAYRNLFQQQQETNARLIICCFHYHVSQHLPSHKFNLLEEARLKDTY